MAEAARKNDSFDTSQEYLGNVYAKALLGVTEAAKNTATVVEEFDSLIADVLNKLPQFEATLASARVPHTDTERILDKAFSGKMSPQLLNFLKVVSKHGRLNCLRAINRAVHRAYDLMRGRIAVQIQTAEPIGKDVMDLIATRLRKATGCEIDLRSHVDSDLIGGVVIRIGDTVYDGSVKTRLSRMRDEALDKTLQQLRQTGSRFVVAS